MREVINVVPLRHLAPKAHIVKFTEEMCGRSERATTSLIFHKRLVWGFSRIHGIRQRSATSNNPRVASSKKFASAICCCSLGARSLMPRGKSLDLIAGRRACEKVVHGKAMKTPRQLPDLIRARMRSRTGLRLRSPEGPWRMSNDLTATPRVRSALVTPSVPEKSSMKNGLSRSAPACFLTGLLIVFAATGLGGLRRSGGRNVSGQL
jgi:hypothetical protein